MSELDTITNPTCMTATTGHMRAGGAALRWALQQVSSSHLSLWSRSHHCQAVWAALLVAVLIRLVFKTLGLILAQPHTRPQASPPAPAPAQSAGGVSDVATPPVAVRGDASAVGGGDAADMSSGELHKRQGASASKEAVSPSGSGRPPVAGPAAAISSFSTWQRLSVEWMKGDSTEPQHDSTPRSTDALAAAMGSVDSSYGGSDETMRGGRAVRRRSYLSWVGEAWGRRSASFNLWLGPKAKSKEE